MGIKKLEMFFLYQEYGFNQYSNIILQFDTAYPYLIRNGLIRLMIRTKDMPLTFKN